MANLIKAATLTRGVVALVAFVVVLALGAVFICSKKEGRTMDLTENNVVTEATTPPMDVSATTETATATFALG